MTVDSPVLGLYDIGEFIRKTCGESVSFGLTIYGFVQNTTAEVAKDKLNALLIFLVSTLTSVSFNNKVIKPTLYPYVPYFSLGLIFVYPTNPI